MNPAFPRPARTLMVLAGALLLVPVSLLSQTTSSSSSSTSERWLHVRVVNTDNHGETVRVNVPLEMAEKVLPAIDKDRLHKGKVRIEQKEIEGVDLKALLDAVRSSKDGEYVTVQGSDNDVRVAKQNG